jgi:hypothetical protein
MAQTSKASDRKKSATSEPLRFAHPFYASNTAPAKRPPQAGYGQRMLDHIAKNLAKIPKVKSTGPMTLAAIIGDTAASEIQKAGKISFHVGGDSGVPDVLDRETRQVMVSDAMTSDFNTTDSAGSPAFLYHLGDVIYTQAKGNYLSEFYVPYKHYPGKIVGIPGNHDGETPEKIADFQKYFCADNQTVPDVAGTIFRQTMNQPGVYWLLDAPLVQIIGLYSNCAENPGYISGAVPGNDQKKWLISTLKQIAGERKSGNRKALLITTHHPPYASGGHSGSIDMLHDIDDACKQAGIMPDVHLSGHAHSIQRYTRKVPFGGKVLQIPYLIYGCMGHGGQAVSPKFPLTQNDQTYEFGYKGWGYALVEATAQALTLTAYGVDWDANQKAIKTPIDKIIVSLANNTVQAVKLPPAGSRKPKQ